jgi:hypothetical protein
MAGNDVGLQREWRLPEVFRVRALPRPVSCLKTSLTSWVISSLRRHQAEVGIEPGGARVVVAGAEVGVAFQAAFFAADDQQRLGVTL